MRSELLKLLTVRSAVVGAVLSTLAAPVLALLVGNTGGVASHESLVAAAATASLAGALGFGAWATLTTTGEYAHGTIAVSLVVAGSRRRLFLAKAGAAAAVALFGGVIAMAAALVLVAAAQPPGDHRLGPVGALAVVPVVDAAVAVAGVAVGVLVRSPLPAVAVLGVALLAPRAAAGLLGGLQRWVVGASPGTVVTQWVAHASVPAADRFPLGAVAALVGLLVVSGAVAAAATTVLGRRDGG